MGSETVTLTSIYDLLNRLGIGRQAGEPQAAAAKYKPNHNGSIIIEGKM